MSAKDFMTRDQVVALVTELLDAAVASGRTCQQLAERIEKTKFLAQQEANAIARELAQRANEPPIPEWTAVTVSPSSKRSKITTPPVKEVGPNGFAITIGGDFVIMKDGHASRQEFRKSDVDDMMRLDTVFAALVESGELVLTRMSEAEARPLEEHLRQFRSKGEAMGKTTAGGTHFGGPRGGVFQGS